MNKFYKIHTKSYENFEVSNQKELWDKLKDKGYEGISILVDTKMEKSADTKFHAVFSTDSVDRHGDIVKQVFDLKHYKKNPVYLDSHNYSSIEHILGKVNKISTKTGKLEGEIEFMIDNPKGLLAMKMAEGGFLSASSIGFIPKDFNEKGDIINSEILEISAVSVPANAEALFEKLYDKEIDTDVEQVDTSKEEDNEEVCKAGGKEVEETADVDREETEKEEKKNKRLDLLTGIAKELSKVDTEKRNAKRKIYKALRTLSKDIADN